MKLIYMTMAAASGLALAAPAAAQPWNGNGNGNINANVAHVAQLQTRFDAGVESGAISRREARPLQMRLRQLTQLQQQYGRNGFNRWERTDLQRRSADLRSDIRIAARDGNGRFDRDGRAGWDDRSDRDGRADWDDRSDRDGRADWDDRSDRDSRYSRDDMSGRGHGGDRFAGDVRVGQRFSSRMVALPAQYRTRYRDDRASYYRFDDGRVYQIDRTSGLILRMIDIQG